MRRIKVLVRIAFVFFIASGIYYFGVDEDNHYDKCCDLNGSRGENSDEYNKNLAKRLKKILGENLRLFWGNEMENLDKNYEINLLKNKMENLDKYSEENPLVNPYWLYDKVKKKTTDFVLILFENKKNNIFEFNNKNINVKIELDKIEGKATIKNLNDIAGTLKTDTKKWAFFEIKYIKNEKGNENEEIVYLYCSDIESVNEKGIFEDMVNFLSVSVIVCNTENVTDMQEMFSYCKEIQQLDLKNFNTQNVTNMELMFDDCRKLEKLNLSNFNTKNVISMNKMFANCEKLQQLDISNFDICNVKNISCLFSHCTNLSCLKIGNNFKFKDQRGCDTMFFNCMAIQNLNPNLNLYDPESIIDYFKNETPKFGKIF